MLGPKHIHSSEVPCIYCIPRKWTNWWGYTWCACQALMGPNTHTRPVISSSFCVVTCTNINSAIQMRLRFTVCCTIIFSTSWRKNRPLWYIYRLQKLFHYHSYLMILVSLISMNIGWDSLLLFTSPLGVNPCRSTDPLKAGRGRATVPFLRMRTKKKTA